MKLRSSRREELQGVSAAPKLEASQELQSVSAAPKLEA